MTDRKQLLENDEIPDDDNDGVMTVTKLDDDTEMDDNLFENDFDDDGNFVGTDDDEPTEPYKDDFSPEPEQEPEKPQEPAKVNKTQLSPEAIKIINLKKELAESQKQQRELLEAQKKIQLDKEIETRQEKLVEQGYDPDTAKKFTELEVRQQQIEERVAKADFLEDNFEVFARYPQAKANIATIMNNAKLTGMTAEQICKGLYELPAHEQRAINSVKGNIPQNNGKPNLNNARTASADTDVLSPKELQHKAHLERMFNDGEKIPTDTYIKKYRRN